LPYKDYDSATGLFINNKTIGFMFEARPLPGGKSIVATLEHLLRSKNPRGVPVSFHLVSSKLVGNDIDYGLREFRWSGKQAKKFNAITRPTISGRRKRSSLCRKAGFTPDAA
jgi:conjugal transfer ATP-binding protein TraC